MQIRMILCNSCERYIHIYTWNPNDLLLVRKGLFVEGLTIKNRGHLGSRYIYMLYIIIYIYIYLYTYHISKHPIHSSNAHEAHIFFLCYLGVVSGRRFPKTFDFRMLQRGFELLTILESYC